MSRNIRNVDTIVFLPREQVYTMWFAEYFVFIFTIFKVSLYVYGVPSQYKSGGNDFVEYNFPNDSLETANSLASNKLPESFHFGIATIPYTIEEAWNVSDDGESIWDYMTREHPVIVNNRSDVGTTEEHNDIQLVKMLGCDIYEMSLSWSRILPDGLTTQVDKNVIRYYNNSINEMLENGIQPVVTMFKDDLPYPLQLLGGWTNSLITNFFEQYARIVFDAFGDRVKYWMTISRPIDICTIDHASSNTLHQPDGVDYLCGHNILLAHSRVYKLYNREFSFQKGKIGIALPLTWFQPENKTLYEDLAATEQAYQWFNEWFLHPLLGGDYSEILIADVISSSLYKGFSRSQLPTFTDVQVTDLLRSMHFLVIDYRTTRTIRGKLPTFYDIVFGNEAKTVKIYENDSADNFSIQNTTRGLEKLFNRLNFQYFLPQIIIMDGEYYKCNLLHEMINVMKKGVDITGYMIY